ncbi:MAG: helix-turn-helix transcriptional regulator [Ruminococcaceae bacterium]|nr:helix-turn-helix transcriptional regulator [Oscillospiraceae bacterium]
MDKVLSEMDVVLEHIPKCHTVYRAYPWDCGIARQGQLPKGLHKYTLMLVTEGSFIIHFRDCKPLTAPAGTFVLKKLTDDFFEHTSDMLPFRYYLVGFFTRDPLPLDFSLNTSLLAAPEDYPEAERKIKEAYGIFMRKDPGWKVNMRSRTLSLIWMFIHAYAESREQQSKMVQQKPPSFLLEAIGIIEADAFNPYLTVNDVAEQCHVSVEHLIRVFTQQKGMTPKQYINAIKIGKVCEYLRSTDSTVEEIINKTGFSDSAQMRRLFKARTGMTPKEYRKKYMYIF